MQRIQSGFCLRFTNWNDVNESNDGNRQPILSVSYASICSDCTLWSHTDGRVSIYCRGSGQERCRKITLLFSCIVILTPSSNLIQISTSCTSSYFATFLAHSPANQGCPYRLKRIAMSLPLMYHNTRSYPRNAEMEHCPCLFPYYHKSG